MTARAPVLGADALGSAAPAVCRAARGGSRTDTFQLVYSVQEPVTYHTTASSRTINASARSPDPDCSPPPCRHKGKGGGADIVIATPGRLVQLVEERRVRLGRLGLLVVDEADRMLDLGLWPDVRRLVGRGKGRGMICEK